MLIDFELPEELIATHPSQQRDHCKMLVYERATGILRHVLFHEIDLVLNSEYFLVLNQARVNPCRLFWLDSSTKQQEILFLKNIQDGENSSVWEAIVSGKNLHVGTWYKIENDLSFSLVDDRKNSLAVVKVNKNKKALDQILETSAQLPIPPYILKRRAEQGEEKYSDQDQHHYQTIFSKKSGAVAAPTAGLHFTDDTFSSLKKKKIDWDFLHLEVGWGTFAGLTQENFETKKLHAEHVDLTSETAKNILSAIGRRKKILAVGTTTVRSLETWGQMGKSETGYQGDTEIFILPSYQFSVVDAMLTNFHIPKSSLLLLVSAFLGQDGDKKTLDIYHEAIAQKYRFYSYGDCMLIL